MKRACKITFDGLNLEKLLNTLQKQQIPVLKAKKTSKIGCEIVIYAVFCKKVVALLKQKCYNNIYVTKLGWYSLWQKCQQHLAFFVAICLVIPTLLISSAFCLRIKVDSTLAREQVLEVLADNNVTIGTLQKNIDCKSLENALASKLGVSYALVSKSGSTLSVKLIDVQHAPPPVNLSDPRNLVAACDGIVTRLVVVQGTAVVKVGDKVSKGQLLIEGKRHYTDGTFDQVCAIGQVWAEVSVSATATHNAMQSILVDTDQTFSRTTIGLGKYISQKDVPYKHFRLVDEKSVNLGGVVLTKQTFCKQVYQQVQVEFASCIDQLKKQALAQATAQAQFEIKSTNYVIQPNSVTVTVVGKLDVAASN